MIEIILFPNPQPPAKAAANPLSLVGATVSLMIPSSAEPSAAAPYPTLVAMEINTDDPNPTNQFAYYTARPGVDFPTPGVYSLQARITYEGGIQLQTNPFNFTVVSESSQTTALYVPFTRIRTGFLVWFRPRRAWG